MSNDPQPRRGQLVEAVVASTVGTAIEWYDFFLYSTATVLVFPRLFFPTLEPFPAQILSFLTFTAGFVSRPVGGVVFGYLGDRIGRKSTLVATLLLMGVSTMLIGTLPGYTQIGVAAPLLLTVLRCAQGLGVGGEWGGAVLLALEYGHRGRRGFLASWPQAGVPIGLLTANGALYLFKAVLSAEAFLDWGWRVPFFLSGLLIVVGLVIRARLFETPLFARLKQTNQVARQPIFETLRRHWREVLLVAGIRLTENACFYLFAIYVIAYAKAALGMGEEYQGMFLEAVAWGAAAQVVAIPLFGLLSDYVSRKGAYVGGCLFLIAFAWPYYALLQTRDPLWITVATVVAMTFGHAVLYSVQASLIPELFGTRLRYSGASLGYQLGAPLAGGLAPIIAASLVQAFPGEYWPLVLYIIVMSVISLACVLLLAETSRKDISGD